MLIMDQKVTTQPILGELDGRGVKFATLRMRSPQPDQAHQRPGRQRLQDRDPEPARLLDGAQDCDDRGFLRPAQPAQGP